MITQEWNTILMTLIFSLPAVTSVICAMIVVIYGREAGNIPPRLTGILIMTFMVSAFGWGCLMLYSQWHVLFVLVQAFFYYAFMIFYVLLYHIIYFVTNTGQKEHFSKLHYIVPAIIPAAIFIWSFFVPLDVQLQIVTSRGRTIAGYEAYTALFTSKALGFLLWNITYSLLSFRRVMAYLRMIGDYSADEGHSPIRWLRILILYMFSVFMLPLIAIGLGKTVFAGSLWMLLPVMLTAMGLIILCYNVVSENYIIITDAELKTDVDQGKRRHINRAYFEHYIQTQKPYLNPKIRITDIAADLHSNRTYVSNFINSEYGMNFSRYINQQRLRKLDSLCFDPGNKNSLGIDLIIQAGFSTYRGYTRAKAEEDKNRLLKEFE